MSNQEAKLLRIVAAVVDTRQMTLYKEDGSTITIPQGDSRIRRIVDEATPQILKQGWADIDVSDDSVNSYRQFEEKTSGMVRLFRIAKKKLESIFKSEPDIVDSMQLGELPQKEDVQKALSAMDEVIKHAQPVSHPEFNELGVAKQNKIVEKDGATPNKNPEDNSTHTMVAVVGNKVIPGVEKIKNQFDRASRLGSTEGVENFLKRISAFIDQRRHSVEDLLKFMERGDLPIADDGSIVIYKILRRKDGHYVDCHTQQVPQKLGSLVCMSPDLVDPNRRNECSNGLHVARRGYISQFHGDVCVIAKVHPEDVIAVPEYDANKMRVCGYHILFELSQDDYSKLKANRPITDTRDGQILLGRALRGDHPPPIEEVRIGGHRGTNIKVTALSKTGTKGTSTTVEITASALTDDPQAESLDSPVDAAQVSKQVEQDRAKAPQPVQNAAPSRKERARTLFHEILGASTSDEEKRLAALLVAHKRASKSSWSTLGITDDEVVYLDKVLEKPDPKKPSPAPKEEPKAKTKGKPAVSGTSQRELVASLWAGVESGDREAAAELQALKKKAKKSYTALSLPDEAEAKIKSLLG